MRAPTSIRFRLLAYAGIGACVSLLIVGIGLVDLFDRYAVRRAGFEMRNYLIQIEGGLNVADDGAIEIRGGPPNPRFTVLGSGLYWQVFEDASGTTLRSASLGRDNLPRPPGSPGPATVSFDGALKGGLPGELLARTLTVSATDGTAGPHELLMVVGMDRREIDELRDAFTAGMTPILVGLAVLGVVAAWLQVSFGLRPLTRVREQVHAVRTGERRRLSPDFPVEIDPLVAELNGLLETQEKLVEREKHRAADLAHGIKTPLTALASDIARLRAAGQSAIAADIESLSVQMRGAVERELARARVWPGQSISQQTLLADTVDPVVRTLQRTLAGETRRIETSIPEGFTLPLAADELMDIVGNLLENALRAARGTVRLTAEAGVDEVGFIVEDDGAGLERQEMDRVTGRGLQLDRAPGQAGIGLAIVADILERRGGRLTFDHAPLGGLLARVTVPRAQADTPASAPR